MSVASSGTKNLSETALDIQSVQTAILDQKYEEAQNLLQVIATKMDHKFTTVFGKEPSEESVVNALIEIQMLSITIQAADRSKIQDITAFAKDSVKSEQAIPPKKKKGAVVSTREHFNRDFINLYKQTTNDFADKMLVDMDLVLDHFRKQKPGRQEELLGFFALKLQENYANLNSPPLNAFDIKNNEILLRLYIRAFPDLKSLSLEGGAKNVLKELLPNVGEYYPKLEHLNVKITQITASGSDAVRQGENNRNRIDALFSNLHHCKQLKTFTLDLSSVRDYTVLNYAAGQAMTGIKERTTSITMKKLEGRLVKTMTFNHPQDLAQAVPNNSTAKPCIATFHFGKPEESKNNDPAKK